MDEIFYSIGRTAAGVLFIVGGMMICAAVQVWWDLRQPGGRWR